MPENPNLYEPANGISRCKVCEKVGEPHKHSAVDWCGFRWKRNSRWDRPVVVFYALAWMFFLATLIGWGRSLVTANWL